MVLTSLLSFIKNSMPVQCFSPSSQSGKSWRCLGPMVEFYVSENEYGTQDVSKWQQIIMAGNNLAYKLMGSTVYEVPNISMKCETFHQDLLHCLHKRCFKYPNVRSHVSSTPSWGAKIFLHLSWITQTPRSVTDLTFFIFLYPPVLLKRVFQAEVSWLVFTR